VARVSVATVGEINDEEIEKIPLRFRDGFAWRAVAAVMAEKFGARGLRLVVMVAVVIGYLLWRGNSSIGASLLYGFAVLCLVFFVGVVWVAKDSLDKFVAKHSHNAWLTVAEDGVGGEAIGDNGAERFHVPWAEFRRLANRNGFWLMETRQGAWMVLPTTHFTSRAWSLFREKATLLTKSRSSK
jgi:hypothetical protein